MSLKRKKDHLSKQIAESVYITNLKQIEEKENKKVCFPSEPVCIITNNEEMNEVKVLDANYEKAN